MQSTSTKAMRYSLILLLLIWMALPACCRIYQDNFGAVYVFTSLLSQDPEGDVLEVLGTVNTGDIGCGVWNLEGTIDSSGNEPILDWFVRNPDPTDACCEEFHFFQGRFTGTGCLTISGEYEMTDGKCTQSGQMELSGL